jgi:hypothetical protein
MPIRCKIILHLLLFCLLGLGAEAAQGPFMVNLDVSPGAWKAIRLRNLAKSNVLAVQVMSDGEILVLLLNTTEYKKFPDTPQPLFLGLVRDKLSFSVTIPDSETYYLLFDNRPGQQQRSVKATVGADGNTSEVSAADKLLRQFDRQLHRILIFDQFPIGIEQCDSMKAFRGGEGLILCLDYIQALFRHLGNKQDAGNAFSFSLFHELSRMLLSQWKHPRASRKETADEFAAVFMIMLDQKPALSAHVKQFARNASLSPGIMKDMNDDRHPLTVQRSKKLLASMENPDFVRSWQPWLVPHMQTAFLEALRRRPPEWTDLPLVEKELSLRAAKRKPL